MSDAAYQNALVRKARLERELKEVDEFLRQWRKFAKSGSERPSNDLKPALEPDKTFPQEAVDKATHSNPGVGELRDIIVRMLVDYGGPMTRGRMLQELRRRDILIRAKNPAKHLGTMLWRMRESFVNIEGWGYWPRDRAHVSLGYDPSNPSSLEEIASKYKVRISDSKDL